LIENHILGGLLGRKHSMTLNGGACILNYSRAALTNCPMDFGLLFSKVGREKKNKANLCKNSERLKVLKTVTTLQQLEIILPVLLL